MNFMKQNVRTLLILKAEILSDIICELKMLFYKYKSCNLQRSLSTFNLCFFPSHSLIWERYSQSA